MNNIKYEKCFIDDSKEYIEMIKSEKEMERLWGVAKIEEKCFGNGMPFSVLELLIKMALNDESNIVRAFTLRSLYHMSSETWPYGVEDRKKILNYIQILKSSQNNYNFSQYIACEINLIEKKTHWLNDPSFYRE